MECLALVYSVKKLSPYLYGEIFVIRTDAKSLIFLLNTLDCPDPAMNRWLAYLKLFSFSICHLPGKSNVVADTLSRLPWSSPVSADLEDEIVFASCASVSASSSVLPFRAEKFSGEDRLIGIYLSTMKRPDGLSDKEWNSVVKKSRYYLLRDGMLWKKGKKLFDVPRKIVTDLPVKKQLMETIHSRFAGGHRGVTTTFAK